MGGKAQARESPAEVPCLINIGLEIQSAAVGHEQRGLTRGGQREHEDLLDEPRVA
jgi:hypothetical protein